MVRFNQVGVCFPDCFTCNRDLSMHSAFLTVAFPNLPVESLRVVGKGDHLLDFTFISHPSSFMCSF